MTALAHDLAENLIRAGWAGGMRVCDMALQLEKPIGWVSEEVRRLKLPLRGPTPLTDEERTALVAASKLTGDEYRTLVRAAVNIQLKAGRLTPQGAQEVMATAERAIRKATAKMC